MLLCCGGPPLLAVQSRPLLPSSSRSGLWCPVTRWPQGAQCPVSSICHDINITSAHLSPAALSSQSRLRARQNTASCSSAAWLAAAGGLLQRCSTAPAPHQPRQSLVRSYSLQSTVYPVYSLQLHRYTRLVASLHTVTNTPAPWWTSASTRPPPSRRQRTR